MHPSTEDGTGSDLTPLSRRSVRDAEPRQHRRGRLPETAADLTTERLLGTRRPVPEGGWRRAVFRASGGAINPGESGQVRRRLAIELRVQAPVPGPAHFVPVLTRKGGVGKTTVTTLIGQAMASLREDRVVAVDANPDRGTLAERVHRQNEATVRHVVEQAPFLQTFSDMSRLVSRSLTRLDVIASDTDPAVAEVFGEDDYKVVAETLARHYSIVLTDCGTGLVHSVMRGVLDLASSLVLVSGCSLDEARLASETLTWLEAHGYNQLVREAVVALNSSNPTARAVDVDEVERHFATRCRRVLRVPYDPHLAEGAVIELDRLRPATVEAVLELAAAVVDGLHD